MSSIYLQIAMNLGAAWLAGGIIGAERSFHGRAAGFRTHALVAIASAAAAMVSLAPAFSPGMFPGDAPRLDPTRLAQGVMTGIGFLGAGVIFKEGVNVQGLTTAASVWSTAAIGLLFGLGEHPVGVSATVAVLFTLMALRRLEDVFPARVYAWSIFRFLAQSAPSQAGLIELLGQHEVTMRELSFGRSQDGILEFRGNLTAASDHALDVLAAHLREIDGLVGFDISRISK